MQNSQPTIIKKSTAAGHTATRKKKKTRRAAGYTSGRQTHLYSPRHRLHSETAVFSLDRIHRSLGAADSSDCEKRGVQGIVRNMTSSEAPPPVCHLEHAGCGLCKIYTVSIPRNVLRRCRHSRFPRRCSPRRLALAKVCSSHVKQDRKEPVQTSTFIQPRRTRACLYAIAPPVRLKKHPALSLSPSLFSLIKSVS